MASLVLLAQALPSASSGVDWLYQFTNNLTNLTTQNGGALTQLGMTELSCIALFRYVPTKLHRPLHSHQHGHQLEFLQHDIPASQSSGSSGRSHEVPVAAHHLLLARKLLRASCRERG